MWTTDASENTLWGTSAMGWGTVGNWYLHKGLRNVSFLLNFYLDKFVNDSELLIAFPLECCSLFISLLLFVSCVPL